MKNSHTHLWIELRRLLATGSNTRKTNMVNCIQEQGVAAADLSHCLLRKTDGEWADLQTITAMRSLQTDQRDSGGACCSDSYIYRCGLITCPGKIALSQKRSHSVSQREISWISGVINMNTSYILYQSSLHLTAVLPVSLSALTVKVHEKLEWHSVESIAPSRPGDTFKSVMSNPIWNRTYLKVQYVAFGKKLIKLSKQTKLKGQHRFTLFYFVYMWRTPPPF